MTSDLIFTCAWPLASSLEEGGNQKAVSATFAVLSTALWLLGTCLGSDRAARGLFSGLYPAVLWLKIVSPSFSPAGHWGPEAAEKVR